MRKARERPGLAAPTTYRCAGSVRNQSVRVARQSETSNLTVSGEICFTLSPSVEVVINLLTALTKKLRMAISIAKITLSGFEVLVRLRLWMTGSRADCNVPCNRGMVRFLGR